MLSVAGCAIVLTGCTASPSPSTPPSVHAPPMGWNSWNSGIELSGPSVKQTIDAMVSSGMRDAGYRYVNLDAGWAAPTRDADGNLRADPDRFPDGIAGHRQDFVRRVVADERRARGASGSVRRTMDNLLFGFDEFHRLHERHR
jgi:hypothetical protein